MKLFLVDGQMAKSELLELKIHSYCGKLTMLIKEELQLFAWLIMRNLLQVEVKEVNAEFGKLDQENWFLI